MPAQETDDLAQPAPPVAPAARAPGPLGHGELPGAAEPTRDETRNVLLDAGAVVGTEPDNRWRVLDHIDDGGFSSVYEIEPATEQTAARHGQVHRALKCLWGTPEELDALSAEADKTAAVEGHDNVLALITSFRFGLSAHAVPQYVGLVLELAAEDLYQLGDRVVPSERAWAAIFEGVAAGLEHIHARRIVHGDIKPTNLLRVGPRCTIADFGVSAPMESTRGASIGLARTIAFWPPETRDQGQLGADGVRRPPEEGWRATQMGDIWALAVTMHRILTNRHITTATTAEQQYELVCAGRYAVDDRLSPGWRQLLKDCLVYEPDERPVRTAAQLRHRLAELVLSEDYESVPWSDDGPRIIAVLPADDQILALYQTKPLGRVQGAFVGRPGLLLDANRHLTDVVIPSLAQQARDGKRAVARLAAQAERLREIEERLSDQDGPSTQLVLDAELEHTRQIAMALAEVTRERDRLRQRAAEMARRLERLERGGTRAQGQGQGQVAPVPAGGTGAPRAPVTAGQPTGQPTATTPPRRQPRFGWFGQLLLTFAVLTLAVVLGMVVAAYTFHTDPLEVIIQVWRRVFAHLHKVP
jgi:serine/threonine protein kinase